MPTTPRPAALAFTLEDLEAIQEARETLRPFGVRLTVATDHEDYPEMLTVLPCGDGGEAAFLVWRTAAGYWRIEDHRGGLSETTVGGNWTAEKALAWITEALRLDREAVAGAAWSFRDAWDAA